MGMGFYCQNMGNSACSLPGNSCCAEAVEGFGMSFSSCQTYWPAELFSHDSEGKFGDFPYLPGWFLWGAGWEEKAIAFGGCRMLSSSQPSSCSSICADRAPGRARTASGRRVKGTAGWSRSQSWEQVSMAGSMPVLPKNPSPGFAGPLSEAGDLLVAVLVMRQEGENRMDRATPPLCLRFSGS